RITFIPPNSNYLRVQFKLLPENELKFKNYNEVEVQNVTNKKMEKAFEKILSKDSSPLVFRNFITMSYDENFSNEFYVDNEFFISKVTKIKSTQFEGIQREENRAFFAKDENGRVIRINPFKSMKSFYTKI